MKIKPKYAVFGLGLLAVSVHCGGAVEADDEQVVRADANPPAGDIHDASPAPGQDASSSDEVPPLGGDALFAWLQSASYASYVSEPAVHASAGPHGGGVRTFVNQRLALSLAAGDPVHPVGAAAVKELYDGQRLDGWAVMIKVDTNNGTGAGWYWYEDFGTDINDPVADGVGVSLCAGCHSSGRDFFTTENFPGP